MAVSHLVWNSLFCLSLAVTCQSAVPASAAPGAAGAANDRITLDVIVNDKAGKPVTGLQQQDFTIFDNKQPRKIVSFEAADSSDSGEITLVIDAVNTSFTRVAYERDQIKRFLQRDAGKLAHPVSLAFFSDAGVSMQDNASRDGNALAAELDANPNGLRSIRRSQGYYGAVDRSQLSLRALNEIVEHQAKRPGRKMVIWVSPGWPLLSGPNMQLSPRDEQGIFNSIVATSTRLRQSRVVLYDVDPLGTTEGLARQTYYEEFLKGVRTKNQAQIGDLSLQVLTYQSGGRVLDGNNDLAGEIEKCVRDTNAAYVLSFDPAPADGPDEYHAIEVKIVQHGLKAQTRSGYYAQPVPRQAP